MRQLAKHRRIWFIEQHRDQPTKQTIVIGEHSGIHLSLRFGRQDTTETAAMPVETLKNKRNQNTNLWRVCFQLRGIKLAPF